MAANLTMYVLNERAQFAYNHPNAAVAETHRGFEVFECAFRFHGIPFFSRRGIERQRFPDQAALEKHFRGLIARDLKLSQLDRLTQKAREVYADGTVTVRRSDDGFCIRHNEAQAPVHGFRTRSYERRIRDIMVARRASLHPTPVRFDSLDALSRFLDERAVGQAREAERREALARASAMAQAAFPDQGARVFAGKRASDRFAYVVVLAEAVDAERELGFASIEALLAFLDTRTRSDFPRRRVANDNVPRYSGEALALSS
ncbi:hypothetical protein [Propionivibrio dicarboxylicus]|uniref:Uncharacterized protein n=1 Tax=Propionivibrio dicarboxylicus TaxID=83767 RepID=A0A1G8I2D0_9RHOO|nr:hypothetical protein [Propionivibrio dicarboxylicus]SDI12800.1 hypothetical protein SAMN05660652_02905 [Propionivibrio dicarboxylicus]